MLQLSIFHRWNNGELLTDLESFKLDLLNAYYNNFVLLNETDQPEAVRFRKNYPEFFEYPELEITSKNHQRFEGFLEGQQDADVYYTTADRNHQYGALELSDLLSKYRVTANYSNGGNIIEISF